MDFRTAGGLPVDSSALKKYIIMSGCSSASFLYKVNGKHTNLEHGRRISLGKLGFLLGSSGAVRIFEFFLERRQHFDRQTLRS